MATLPYWEMEPANHLVSPNHEVVQGRPYRTSFCLAKAGDVYLVFSLNGEPLMLDLVEGSTYQVTQIDPRTGQQRQVGHVDGGRQRISPTGREQVLICRRNGE